MIGLLKFIFGIAVQFAIFSLLCFIGANSGITAVETINFLAWLFGAYLIFAVLASLP